MKIKGELHWHSGSPIRVYAKEYLYIEVEAH